MKLISAIVAVSLLGLLAGCKPQSTATEENHKNVITVTKANMQAEVLSSTQPVLVDFWATWCGPCKMIAPVVNELAAEYEGRAKFGKVDVDVEGDLAKEYEVSAIPLLIIFKDGKPFEQFVGVKSKGELKAALDKAIAAGTPAAAPAP